MGRSKKRPGAGAAGFFGAGGSSWELAPGARAAARTQAATPRAGDLMGPPPTGFPDVPRSPAPRGLVPAGRARRPGASEAPRAPRARPPPVRRPGDRAAPATGVL